MAKGLTKNAKFMLGTIAVVVGIAILYFILANMLFKRTHEMLLSSIENRSQMTVAKLASDISFQFAAGLNDEIRDAFEAHIEANPEVKLLAIIDKNGKTVVNVGTAKTPLATLRTKRMESFKPQVENDLLTATAPCFHGSGSQVIGHIIYAESTAMYSGYRQQMIIVAIVASILGILIIAKLIHAQIRIALENMKLYRNLETQAEDLKTTNLTMEHEIQHRIKAEQALEQYKDQLEDLVEERTRDLKQAQHRLVETSRRAGMADVATGVLHNVGNVLNSVNVAINLMQRLNQGSKVPGLANVTRDLNQHSTDLGQYLATDDRGKKMLIYMEKVIDALQKEHRAMSEQIAETVQRVKQINTIVSVQQSYAKLGGTSELCTAQELVEDALDILSASLTRHQITVIREDEPLPNIVIDKYKVVHILVNLLSNAKHALKQSDENNRAITTQINQGDNGNLCISISDTGIGIPAENLERIFNHGFTTRKDGHGFGLHNAANAAKELGGSLNVHSAGTGKGARFDLELPMRRHDSD